MANDAPGVQGPRRESGARRIRTAFGARSGAFPSAAAAVHPPPRDQRCPTRSGARRIDNMTPPEFFIDPSRCIGCQTCVLACPFGVPRYVARIDQMVKCDMCYDRTSVGKKPMCVTVCPRGALAFGPREEFL